MDLFWIAQAVSVVTLIATVFGMLQKEKFKAMLWFTIANLAILTTYILLERYLGTVLVVGATLRTFVYFLYAKYNRKPNTLVMVFFQAYFVIVSIFLWKDLFDIFMLANLVMLTYTTWQNNIQTFRLGYLFSAVLLLTYDIAVGAYVNVISDILLLGSAVIAIYKYSYKDRIKDIVFDFYSTISDSYDITLTNKEKYALVHSKAIADPYNNFAYLLGGGVTDFQAIAQGAARDIASCKRVPAIYIRNEKYEEIPNIMETIKENKLLYQDVWMMLHGGQNLQYKSCLIPEVQYRKADENDTDALVNLFVAGFIKTSAEDVYKYEYSYADKIKATSSNEDCVTQKKTPYVATLNGEPIAMLYMHRNIYHAYICQITTLEKYRRNGVASSLIRYAIKCERQRGMHDFYLVTEKYTHLEVFYLKNNFEEIARGFCIEYVDKEAKADKQKIESDERLAGTNNQHNKTKIIAEECGEEQQADNISKGNTKSHSKQQKKRGTKKD